MAPYGVGRNRPSLSFRQGHIHFMPLKRPAPAPYSTVTDFARFRGWSAYFPVVTAV
jgi:hypothetical protein